MIMHSTTKHHGLPASAPGSATQGTLASQPLPECTVFCLFATDKQGSLVPENAVFTDDDEALPAILPAATALGPCTIPSYTTTLMLGPNVGRATRGLVSPEYLESVLTAGQLYGRLWSDRDQVLRALQGWKAWEERRRLRAAGEGGVGITGALRIGVGVGKVVRSMDRTSTGICGEHRCSPLEHPQ